MRLPKIVLCCYCALLVVLINSIGAAIGILPYIPENKIEAVIKITPFIVMGLLASLSIITLYKRLPLAKQMCIFTTIFYASVIVFGGATVASEALAKTKDTGLSLSLVGIYILLSALYFFLAYKVHKSAPLLEYLRKT